MLRSILCMCCVLYVGCATAGEDVEALPGRKPDTGSAVIDSALAAVDTAMLDSAIAAEDSSAPMESSTDTEVVDTAMPPTTTTLAIDTTECKSIACPASHPFPTGCEVKISGGSSQVCIVLAPGGKDVTFKEGQSCGSETVKGTVTCSTMTGAGLNATNCKTNKSMPLYIAAVSACPD